MGMYTSTVSSTVEVKDEARMLQWLRADGVPGYVRGVRRRGLRSSLGLDDTKSIQQEYVWWKQYVLKEYGENGEDCFQEIFSENKIIGYWYAGFMYFVRDLAQFVEGDVELVYEDGVTFAKLLFGDGECMVQHGEVQYVEPMMLELPPLPVHERLGRKL